MSAWHRALRAAHVLMTPSGARALLTWPTFSITSFEMLRNLSRQGIQPRTIIDIGANNGQFGVAAAKTFPRSVVHSFEPLPECVDRLERIAKAIPNLHVHPRAAGETVGQIALYRNVDSRATSVLKLGATHREIFPHARQLDCITVPVTTLDHEFAASSFDEPVLLKLDVQGYEASVLAGASNLLRRVEWLVLETSFRPMYDGEVVFLDLLERVRNFGFRFLRPIGWLQDDETGEIVQMDALFGRD